MEGKSLYIKFTSACICQIMRDEGKAAWQLLFVAKAQVCIYKSLLNHRQHGKAHWLVLEIPAVFLQRRRQLDKLKLNKAAGHDSINPRILRTCASQLSPVLQHLCNLSLSLERLPLLWKTSCLVPVPKKSFLSGPSDYQPVALTSYLKVVLTAGEIFYGPSAVSLPSVSGGG